MDMPLAYFITWTVYGTFLQGDDRGWWKIKKGTQPAAPRLFQWHQDRLKYPVLTLDRDARDCVKLAIAKHCDHRDWKLWACSVRSNHAHVVVSAGEMNAEKVRDQLKANGTGKLRQLQPVWVNRPVWTTKGWCDFIDTDDDLETVVIYTEVAQDRKERDKC